LDPDAEDLLAFTSRLITLRRRHPVFRRGRFFAGDVGVSGLPDAWWFRLDGLKMTKRDWGREELRSVGLFLNGRELPNRGPRGEEIADDSFLLLFNAAADDETFRLPARRFGARWELELSTAEPEREAGTLQLVARGELVAPSRSVTVLRRSGGP
jgi:isoamylase